MLAKLLKIDALPFQVSGFVGILIGLIGHSFAGAWVGLGIHFFGDAIFFLQQKSKGCL